jgi:hypothetical protein
MFQDEIVDHTGAQRARWDEIALATVAVLVLISLFAAG